MTDRAARFASLARAGRVLKAADPRARVYYDAGHSAWNPAAEQAALLARAGAASAASSDGVFTNVSNFHRTSDEIAYARQVLSALGGPASLGAVIDARPQRQRRPGRRGVVRSGGPEDRPGADPEHRGGQDRRLSLGEAAGGVGRVQGHAGDLLGGVRL